MADELHYRRLYYEIRELVGASEATRLAQGKTTEELLDIKRKLVRELMKPGRAA